MFKNSFSFQGRIRRSEYALTLIFYFILAGIINAIVEGTSSPDAGILGIVYIPMVWFLLAQGAKRCHDIGNSGWWQLIPLYVLWLIFKNGQLGANRYGENPKGIAEMESIPFQENHGPAMNDPQPDEHSLAVRRAKLTRSKKDMIFGFLWFTGGSYLTAQDTGFIFWGAIVYGALQFLKGLYSLTTSMFRKA